jgi:hypothetical protein
MTNEPKPQQAAETDDLGSCKDCGNPFSPTSVEQEYCVECGHIHLGEMIEQIETPTPSYCDHGRNVELEGCNECGKVAKYQPETPAQSGGEEKPHRKGYCKHCGKKGFEFCDDCIMKAAQEIKPSPQPKPLASGEWFVGNSGEAWFDVRYQHWVCQIYRHEKSGPVVVEESTKELCEQIAAQIVDAAKHHSEWRVDSSLERWFPFSAEELATLKLRCGSLLQERNWARAEREKFLAPVRKIIPQTYGEAYQAGWIPLGNIPNYEWDNRTTEENAVWVIQELRQERDRLKAELERVNESNASRGDHGN